MVCTSGVEVQQPLQSGTRELSSEEGDKCLCDWFFGEVALPEDRQDVLDTRAGRFAKDVIPLHPVNVLVYRSIDIPMGKQRLRVPNQGSRFDDFGRVRSRRLKRLLGYDWLIGMVLAGGRQRTTATQSILPLLHSCPGGVCKSAIHSP